MSPEEQAELDAKNQNETEEEKQAREAQEQEEAEKTKAEEDKLKEELEKQQRKGHTKAEKLLYTKKRIDEQIKELGIEEEPPTEDDDQPLTVGQFKKMQAQSATKTAIDLANETSNQVERELLVFHLENTIKSTGDARQDLELAQKIVNGTKNANIIEEMNRKPGTKSGSGGGAPANQKPKDEELTPEELAFMKPPFNLSRKAIMDARKQEQANQT